ncbi:hypothetical protein [Streptomyces californicus]|uniref:hypothetical protein n=1 Tax=Streptomyces californicus TaxID=67351 RepID=UPI00296F381B|nr:hypothetical protein [Streptomyces californicus]MDW4912643.1 hypothetical protein [Streptomyces californicus]
MDFQRGIVLYDLDGTARRLRLSRATVKRHVRILRELGALVWLQHGSRRNLRLPGCPYTATATVYGATIPEAYDNAHGHLLSGDGYTARVVGLTPAGRAKAIAHARKSTAGSRREPPSRSNTTHPLTADERGSSTTTAKPRSDTTARRSLLGHTVTAAAYRTADRFARALRPLHSWLQRTRIEQLSWVLVDKAAEGATLEQVHAWLHEINPAHHYRPSWRPHRAHAYLAGQLLQDAERDQQRRQHAAGPLPSAPPTEEFTTAVAALQVRDEAGTEFADVSCIDELDDSLLQQMRADAWNRFTFHGDTDLVLIAVDGLGRTEASRLYSAPLVDACLRFRAAPQLLPSS